jgi:hypothetical protein
MLVLANVLLPHRLQLGFYPGIAATGAAPGVLAWVIALCFAALPGARRAPGVMPRFGLTQAIWGMCGTLLMMLCGAILPFMAAVYLMLTRILRHLPAHMPDRHDVAVLIASLLASELMAALWLSWYVRRQGPAVAQNGSASGIAWRAAAPRAYAMAALGALVILLLAAAEFHRI